MQIYQAILSIFLLLPLIYSTCDLKQELHMNITEEIKCNGYPVENYKLKTSDGYILQVQRIPHGKKSYNASHVILLMHGFGCEASFYVDQLDNSLAFQLADAGFDVWLGNMRGTKYSLEHKTFTKDDQEFWNFTADDIASKDLPAILTFVLNYTRRNKIFYAGTSLGNLAGMMLLSSQPRWNTRLHGFLGILPVTRMRYMTCPLRGLLEPAAYLLNVVGVPSLLASRPILDKYSPDPILYTEPFQLFKMYSYFGYDPLTSDAFEREDLVIDHCRSGVSLKVFNQFSQLMMTNVNQYSYGYLGNWFEYDSITPPIYNFSKITTPVALFAGENDCVADPLDIALLITDLPNVYHYYIHPYGLFSHNDVTRANATLRTFTKEITRIGLKMANNFT